MTATQPPSMELVELPVPDAARRLGLSAETIRRRVRSGDMTGRQATVNGRRALLVTVPDNDVVPVMRHDRDSRVAPAEDGAPTASVPDLAVTAWQATVDALTAQIDRMAEAHAAELARMQSSHDETLARLADAHRDSVDRLSAAHADSVVRLEAAYVTAISRLESHVTHAANRRRWWHLW